MKINGRNFRRTYFPPSLLFSPLPPIFSIFFIVLYIEGQTENSTNIPTAPSPPKNSWFVRPENKIDLGVFYNSEQK